MKKGKKILTLSLAASMLLSSTVMALPDNSIVMKNKAFSVDALFAGVPGIQQALDTADGLLYYSLEGTQGGFKGLFDGHTMTPAEKSALTNIEYTKADGTKVIYSAFDQSITVQNVTAVNSTTIQVTFLDTATSNTTTQSFSGFQLVPGINHVEFQYQGQTFSADVTLPQPSKAAVEKIEFVNYRYFKVTFDSLVDKVSAADPTNYYLEIIDGDAAYGAMPTLQESNQLSKIETAYTGGATKWWADDHIIAEDIDGKTVVNIYLPEDARFTNVEDSFLGYYPYPSYNSPDAERTLAVEMRTSKTKDVIKKALIKNMVVNVAVRNVKDRTGKLSIDTAVMPIRILDEVKPELLGVYKVENNNKKPPEPKDVKIGGLGRDLGNYDLLRTDKQKGEQLQFVYSEPVFDAHRSDQSDLEYYRDVLLYVNGKRVAALSDKNLHEFMKFRMDKDATYEDSKTVTIDVERAVKEAYKELFETGIYYTIRFVGVTDLAGNIEVSSEHSFKVKFHDDPAPTERIVKPVVEDVVQVADNIFRIEFNRVDVEGRLVIENPDGEGFGELQAYIPRSARSANGHYYSYVNVVAKDHEPNKAVPVGIMQNQILAYDGQDTIYRNIRVEDIFVRAEIDPVSDSDVLGDDYIKNNMKLVDDIKAPKALNPGVIPYVTRGTTISIPVKDIVPWVDDNGKNIDENITYWVSPIAYIYDSITQRFRNTIVVDQRGSDTFLPVKVSYVDANGAVHQALVSNYDLRPDAGEPSDLNPGYTGSITFDRGTDILTLDLSKYPQLLDSEGKLVAGATYSAELKAGYFTDSAKDTNLEDQDIDFVFNGNIYDLLFVDDGRAEENYLWERVNEAGLGYTSIKQIVNVDVESKPIPPAPPEYVPQTSKQLINYDEPTNTMKIEFTGTIDVATLKDKDNYSFDGKTLAEWDALLGTNTVIDYVVDNSNPDDIRQYAVFKIPQDSIQEFGNYDFIVKGVAHPNGGTMTPVETIVRLHDNFRPVVVDAVVTGDSQIKLTFNEPIKYFVDPDKDADPHAVANNFVVKAGDVVWDVDTAVLPGGPDNDREIILSGTKLPDGALTVQIVKDQNGNILVIDLSTNKNPLKEATYNVKR